MFTRWQIHLGPKRFQNWTFFFGGPVIGPDRERIDGTVSPCEQKAYPSRFLDRNHLEPVPCEPKAYPSRVLDRNHLEPVSCEPKAYPSRILDRNHLEPVPCEPKAYPSRVLDRNHLEPVSCEPKAYPSRVLDRNHLEPVPCEHSLRNEVVINKEDRPYQFQVAFNVGERTPNTDWSRDMIVWDNIDCRGWMDLGTRILWGTSCKT